MRSTTGDIAATGDDGGVVHDDEAGGADENGSSETLEGDDDATEEGDEEERGRPGDDDGGDEIRGSSKFCSDGRALEEASTEYSGQLRETALDEVADDDGGTATGRGTSGDTEHRVPLEKTASG